MLLNRRDAEAFVESSAGSGRTPGALKIGGPPLKVNLERAIEACNGLSRVHILSMTCWDALCLPVMAGKALPANVYRDIC